MTTPDDPKTSDRVLAAEIYTRRIRNTVFGAILLVAWLVLLFKDAWAGAAVGAAAALLYGIFLFGRWGLHRPSAREPHPWRIEPTTGRVEIVRPAETVEEYSNLLAVIDTMPGATAGEKDRKVHALAVGAGMVVPDADLRRDRIMLAAMILFALWPLAVAYLLGVSGWPAAGWGWYAAAGCLLVFGGVDGIRRPVSLASVALNASEQRSEARSRLLWALVMLPLGLWLLTVHPVLGDSDPFTTNVVQPVAEFGSRIIDRATKPRRAHATAQGDPWAAFSPHTPSAPKSPAQHNSGSQASPTDVDGIVDSILAGPKGAPGRR